MFILILSVLIITLTTSWPLQNGVPKSFDCAMRKAAYEYGQKLLPRKNNFSDLYYALYLNDPECYVPLKNKVISKEEQKNIKNFVYPKNTVFVATSSNNNNHKLKNKNLYGLSIDNPIINNIQEAIDLASTLKPNYPLDGPKTKRLVILKSGTYYLQDTLYFTAKHSNIHIMKDPNEAIESETVISGGKLIENIIWKPYNVTNNANIWVASIKNQIANHVKVEGLQYKNDNNNLVRATRARYPNAEYGIEVSPGYGGMIPGENATWDKPKAYENATDYIDTKNVRPDYVKKDDTHWFENYKIGIGGPCSVYDPPVSYWCSSETQGGGAFSYRTPTGLTINNSNILPNSPYKDASQARAIVWRPARWANWMFDIENYNPNTNHFKFGKGGNQGARGKNTGGDFYIENIFEELDYPDEFFYNQTTGLLYFYFNNTQQSSPPNELVIPNLKVLINMTSTQWNPIKNISHENIRYQSTSITYMERHAVPSAGDWALARFGAIFLQGTELIHFQHCIFDRLDGHGIMISGYNRNTTIINNDFQYIGGSAIASWGYTNETDYDPGRPGIKLENAPYAGIDGTDGEHPRYNLIKNNVGREIGIYEKQNSFYVQAKTAESYINGNVFFNGPRAGINFNDGFGGGDIISNNLVFSTCRESGDHGPFNSWDRQPFITTINTGTPSLYMKLREIHHNFFIDNYSPQEAIDNDDGSAYYHSHHNFLIYGQRGLKNDFGGHDNYHYNNLYAYTDTAFTSNNQAAGFSDAFYNNKAIINSNILAGPDCDPIAEGGTIMYNNQYYINSQYDPNQMMICGTTLSNFQKNNPSRCVNSTILVHPNDQQIIQWSKDLLDY